MKVKYYPETDTLHIELNSSVVSETRELDEDTMFDMDARGNLCAITIEHASKRADAPQFSFEQSRQSAVI